MEEFEKVDFDQLYVTGAELGKGYFAVVHSCKCRSTGVTFAAKMIRKRRSKASRQGQAIEDIEREVAILRKMNHENIVKLHRVFDSRNNITLLLDLVEEGELFDFVSERDRLSEEEASQFIYQILLGLQHMHNMDIVHLDIKPENILLENRGPFAPMRVKIIDFGLARKLNADDEYRDMVGTPEFVAPEVINYEPIWLWADLWSLGVVTHILLTGESPFRGNNKTHTFQLISLAKLDMECESFQGVSQPAKDFVRRLLVKRPDKRPSATAALDDAWIRPVNEEQSLARRRSHIRRGSLKKMRTFVATPRKVAPPPTDCIEEHWSEMWPEESRGVAEKCTAHSRYTASVSTVTRSGANKLATTSDPPLLLRSCSVNGELTDDLVPLSMRNGEADSENRTL